MKIRFRFPSYKFFGVVLLVGLFILFVCGFLLCFFNVSQYYDIFYILDLPMHIQVVLFVLTFDLIFITFVNVWLIFKVFCENYKKD